MKTVGKDVGFALRLDLELNKSLSTGFMNWCRIFIQVQVWGSWQLRKVLQKKKKTNAFLVVAEVLALDYNQMKNM